MDSKNIIIGTAGHIDHGKTTLIKAMTGQDTDRLQQEKERGISIELGFSNLELSNGQQLGIIDVPGHEHFVKNMLAGAAGVDLALLVVAADEGMMPQSDEHLSILDILGVEHGIVVMTKIDKVEDEWLQLVKEDTREKIKGSFLEEAPIVEVSAPQNEGIEKLLAEIENITEKIEPKNDAANVFYPVDRVFTLKGFGTIVTGTLFSGKIQVEDKVELYPQQRRLRVRSLQVHNDQVDTVYAGQRVGINLAGIEKDEIHRGNVLASPESLIKTKFFEAHLQLLEDKKIVLNHADRIRMHIGSQEVLGRVHFFDREYLLPGEDAYVQFRLEEELVAHFKERFIIRRYSPMETLGGGKILEIDPPPRRKNKEKVVSELKTIEEASDKERIEHFIKKEKNKALSEKDIAQKTDISPAIISDMIEEISSEDKIIKLYNGQEKSWIHQKNLKALKANVLALLKEYHKNNHLQQGMKKSELLTKINLSLNKQEFDKVLEIMLAENLIKEHDNLFSLFEYQIELSSEEIEIRDQLLEKFQNNIFNPPTKEELLEDFKDYNTAQDLFDYLIAQGELLQLKEDIFFYKTALKKAEEILKDYLKSEQTITLAEFRDLLESSRKYTLAILEKFDREKITERNGDQRRLIK